MGDQKNLFFTVLNLFFVVLIIGLVFFGLPFMQKLGNGYPSARTIAVSADGKTTASPDVAEISFSVLSVGKNPDTLSSSNNDKMAAVLQFVKAQKIDDKDIKTVDYNLSPNYQYDENTQRNYITGYTLTQTVLVKVHDLSKVATVVGGLAPLGVNQIGNINFTFDDPEKFLAMARTDAFTKAVTKAKDMASQAGVSLGRVINVSEYGNTPRPYYEAKSMSTGSGVANAPALPTLQPGTQDITDQVTITYELQ